MGNASNAPLRSRLRLGSFSSTSVSHTQGPSCVAANAATGVWTLEVAGSLRDFGGESQESVGYQRVGG